MALLRKLFTKISTRFSKDFFYRLAFFKLSIEIFSNAAHSKSVFALKKKFIFVKYVCLAIIFSLKLYLLYLIVFENLYLNI